MNASRVLRGTAVAIAVLGWLDPPIPAKPPLRVAIFGATDSAESSRLAAQVVSRLGRTAEITDRPDPLADAWVVAAEHAEVDVPAVPDGVALSLITPPNPGASLHLERLDAPSRMVPGQRATLVASFAGAGMQGRTTTIELRAGRLVLARQEHAWTQPHERFDARFGAMLPAAGVNHLTVTATGESGKPLARADVIVATDPQALPILVFEARPSWATTFARRALERDARFAVTFASRVSRRVVASARPGSRESRPAATVDRLSAGVLAPFAVAIVGGVEALEERDVEALRAFAEQRGGAVVLAPDRGAGGALALLDGIAMEEHLLQEPVGIELATMPGLRLASSELLEPRGGVPQAMEPLIRTPAKGPGSAALLLSHLGNGRVLWVGMLDAWRFRSRNDHAFDRFWTQTLEWLARGTAAPLALTLDAGVVRPGTPVGLTVRVLDTDPALPLAVSASLAPEGAPAERRFVRLWPDGGAGAFRATLNAPERPGVYGVSVEVSGGSADRTTRHTTLIVDPNARTAQPPDGRWQAATRARRGVVATPDTLQVLAGALDVLEPRDRAARPWHPLRSAWWLVPFAACLGGEWWLRRRNGQS